MVVDKDGSTKEVEKSKNKRKKRIASANSENLSQTSSLPRPDIQKQPLLNIGKSAKNVDRKCDEPNNIDEPNNNPNIRSNKLSPNFPYHLIKHTAIASRIDPFLPLCPFQLRGRCADEHCPWQHEAEYLLNDQEIVSEIIDFYPNLRPSGITSEYYVKDLLKNDSVELVAQFLFSKIPNSHRRIQFNVNKRTQISHKPIPKSADDKIDYDSPNSSFLSNNQLIQTAR